MSERTNELAWSQMMDESDFTGAERVATDTVGVVGESEFTGITEEHMKLRRELTLALNAAAEFLSSGDQPSSRAEELLLDIDYLQDAVSQTIGIDEITVQRIADITPRLEAIALLRLG